MLKKDKRLRVSKTKNSSVDSISFHIRVFLILMKIDCVCMQQLNGTLQR